MNDRVFTYDEFYKDVERQVIEGRRAFPRDEVLSFVRKEEQLVRDEYTDAIQKYQLGAYTVLNVNIGATSSVANCLILMF